MAAEFKCTQQLRRLVQKAGREAESLQEGFIGTEHLLLALLHSPRCRGHYLLKRLEGVTTAQVEEALNAQLVPGDSFTSRKQQVLTPRACRVVDLAEQEKRSLGDDYLGTHHLLLGLVREEQGIAGQTLKALGVELERLRQQAQALQTKEETG